MTLLAWALLSCLAAGLGLAPRAMALSIAPKAAKEHGCKVQEECVTTQPSTPAWLTLAGGKAFLTQQTLDGTAANEYGTSEAADAALYGSAQPYAAKPQSKAAIVDSVLANLAGNAAAADTYDVVLREDRALELLGPQAQGYANIASATVPQEGELAGVLALGVSPKSETPEQIVVVTSAGFYFYDWSAGKPSTLSLRSSKPSALPGVQSGGDSNVEESAAFTCESSVLGTPEKCEQPRFGEKTEWTYEVPRSDKILSVYQAPASRGEYESDEAASTFAIAYVLESKEPTEYFYQVDFFAYEPSGQVHAFGEIQRLYGTESEVPEQLRYAISHAYLRAATLAPTGKMEEYDVLGAFSEVPAEARPASCPKPSAGEPAPLLAVEAIEEEPERYLEEPSDPIGEQPVTGASLCAAIVEGQIHYQLQRFDTAGISKEGISTSKPGTISPPAGSTITAMGATLDFPCDQFLYQFAKHPTPDGFPETGSGRYCAPVNSGTGAEPFKPEVGAAGLLATQFQYISEEAGGTRSLRQASIAHEPEAFLGGPLGSEVETRAKGPSSEYEQRLATLPAEGPTEVQMLPLDPAGIEWSSHLLESEPGEVLREPASSNPVPVTVMAAPPYYAGGEQQVTPTATTFSNSECGGSGTSQSNTVGVFAGFSGSWLDDQVEFEALAKVEASWTQETEVENCQSFDQEFIAGNFGNNFVADNSLLFRVDTGHDTYLDLTGNSLGIGVTGECTTNDLKACDTVFVPSGSQYVLQNLTQLRHPRPNNFYAKDDRKLYAEYGASLEEQLPRPGNPATYPALVSAGEPAHCAGAPSGAGSGNTGIVDVNPFVAPTPPPAPNLLEASQASEVNPASGGEEGGTASTLSYESSKQNTSSAQFSVGAEVSAKVFYAKFGAEYSHSWGTSMTESFGSGTSFSGGVFDFSGFYDPYSYRLYECKADLSTSPSFPGAASGAHLPVFFVDYMAELSSDELPLNFVTSSASLPEGTAGQEYAGQVFASGGSPAYTYEISAGGLPPGLKIAESTGQISGTPTSPGTYEFTVLAQDSAHNRASEEISITIAPALSMPSTLAEGKVGVPYEQSLGATGGTPAYTYLLTKGTPPPGLHFNNTAGALQGTPTEAGTFCFTVYVADSSFPQGTLEEEVCVTIADALALSPSSSLLPEAAVGGEYAIAFTGSGGYVSGYSYQAGAEPESLCAFNYTCPPEGEPLPPGLSLKTSGGQALLEGTPTAEGSYEFTVSLSDGHGGSVVDAYKIQVHAALAGTAKPASFAGATQATVGTGEEVTVSIECEGTPAPTVSGTGSLPGGLAFDAEEGACGAIKGTAAPGSGGEYELHLQAQNGLGSAASETFTVIVHEGPEINEQPEDRTATAPDGGATFAASATGKPTPSASWEVSTDGGATWSTVPGASSYYLELEGLEPADNGYEYRATFTNAQGSVRSKPATLTVQFAPAIEAQPEDATAIEGAPASFTAAAAGQPAAEVQWQLSTDGGETWTDISGATKPKLAFGSVSAKDQGESYRAVFTNRLGRATTEAATLTVQTSPRLLSEPAGETVTEGGTASFHAAASGGPAPTVQWMLSTGGGAKFTPVKGATSDTLTIESVSASENGNRYEAVFSNPAGEVSTAAATLEVQSPPVVSLQPAPAIIAAGGDATFTAAAAARPAASVQWQLSTDGGRTWTDMSGATSPSLALLDVPAADNGQLYRAAFSNAAGTATTKPALLAVQSAPGLTAAPSGTVGTAGGTATFTVRASGSPPPSIQWEVSEDGGKTWVVIGGATQATLQLKGLKSTQSGFLYRAVLSNSRGTVITTPVTLLVSARHGGSASGGGGAGGLCGRAPRHLPFRNHRLGRVIRYKVLVDGRRVSAHHGHDLRHVVMPKLGRGWHAVKIVAFTSRGFRISTRRVYFGCAKGIGVSKVRRRVHRNGRRNGALSHARRRRNVAHQENPHRRNRG